MGQPKESGPKNSTTAGKENAPRKETPTPSLRLLINGQSEGAALLFDKVLSNGHEIVGIVETIKKTQMGIWTH